MQQKDWTGNKKSTFSTLGASNHSEYERETRDFYATDPRTIDDLIKQENFCNNIWENACGNGHLSKRLEQNGFRVRSSDIIERDFPCEICDFLKNEEANVDMDIITNPPYSHSLEFAKKSIDIVADGHFVAMFLKITFLEGQKRANFFKKYPPKKVCVYSKRVQVARNGDPEMFKKSSAACYAWFIWQKKFVGDPIIKWIN